MEAFGDIGFWDVAWPVVAIVVGALSTLLLLMRQTQSDQAVEASSRRIDLESAVDDAVEVLRALETEQGKMDPAEYAAEREAALARGAAAMAALDGADDTPEASAAPSTPASPGAGWAGQPAWVRGVVSAAAVMVVILGFVYSAGIGSHQRLEGMGMTGGAIVNDDQKQQIPPELQKLFDRVEENPQDIEALNILTQVYIQARQAGPAMDYNQKALAVEPKNPVSRSLRSMLLMHVGESDKAIQMIDEVVAEHPEHPLAATYRGFLLLRIDRYDEAVVALERASALTPGSPDIVRALADAKALAAGERPPSSGALIVAGTMSLAPDAAVTGREMVFVSIREPGQRMPIAATRLPARFPAPFELNTTHFMAGERPLPDTVTLSIRVDTDGNAMTRESAPLAEIEVTTGTEGLDVVLAGGVATPAPAGGSDVLVAGTATLGADVSPEGKVLYISLKSPAGGPPFAAIRRTDVTFPYTFELTSADLIPMMAGRPVPDTLALTVRLDNDGDPLTRDGEPEATTSVAKGTDGVQVALQ